jgi:hypothetical protein
MSAQTPDDLIGLSEACRLIPSRKPGRRLHVATLYRWVLSGRVRGWRIGRGLFVSRADMLRLARPVDVAEDPAAGELRSAAERAKWAEAVLRRHGVL